MLGLMQIEENLAHIKHLISDYEKKYGRESGSVQLLAASKKQPLAKLQAARDAGQLVFGESYVQEALAKMEVLTDIEWHFIGPIQRNKTRKIAEHFNWVQSVDNATIALRLNDQRPPHLPPLNICIEVNVNNEANKSGVSLVDTEAFIRYCLTLPQLNVRGLMAIPKDEQNFSNQRHNFHILANKFNELKTKGFSLDTLSMGMSADFEAAIAEGSTMVRIGSAIFGQRDNIF